MQRMSGSRPECSMANHLPVRPKPVWISSTMRSAPRSRHTRCAVCEEVRRAHVDAALALDHLEDHRGRRVAHGLFQRRRIVERHVRRLQQRLEALAVLRLPRDGQGADGAAVEALGGGDERGPLGEEARELERAVHRFGAAVGEERVRQVLRQDVDERLRELGALVVVEIVGAEREGLRLLDDRLGDARMAVPEHRHALRGAQVEILAAFGVEDPAALAAGNDDVAAARGRAAKDVLLPPGRSPCQPMCVPPPASAFEMGWAMRPSAKITLLTPSSMASTAPITFFFIRPSANCMN